MGPVNVIKGKVFEVVLKRVLDGDNGSTLLGVVAAAILTADVNFSLVVQGFHTQESAMECGKVIGVLVLTVWGYYTGRSKKTPPTEPPVTAALAN